jgi:glycosyltransferase involved in cell wall biosynthesis
MNSPQAGISFVLPALNEEQNIEPLVREIIAYCEARQLPYEIIIVNDGSSDATGSIADSLAAHYKTVHPLHHRHNQGYGKSLRDGFAAGRHDYLFFTDADRQFRISSLDAFLPFMQEGKADMVIGYRIDRKDPAFRKLLAWGFNRMARIFFAVHCRDIDCAFKLFKKSTIRSLQLTSDHFLFNLELLAKARVRGCRIVQLGVTHYPRSGGRSTVSCQSVITTVQRLLTLHGEVRRYTKEHRSRNGSRSS